MSINEAEIRKIAELAQIALTEEDCRRLHQDLNNMIGLCEQLNAADVSNVTPLSHPSDAVQPLRDDIITEINQRELLQSTAPQTHCGLYLVPKVIEIE